MTPEEQQANFDLARKLLEEQNFKVAIFAGTIAAILAAGIYAAVGVVAAYAVAFMSVGVGIIVGFTIQYLGRGVQTKFVVLASILAVVGCILGNVFALLLLQARQSFQTPLDIALRIRPERMLDFVLSTMHPVDPVYWLMAVAAAAYLAKRPLSRAEGLALYTLENRQEEPRIIRE